jgi:hypothetical protein
MGLGLDIYRDICGARVGLWRQAIGIDSIYGVYGLLVKIKAF